jgi:OPA family glycerol-3-phosphate transporter-like MFS transporter
MLIGLQALDYVPKKAAGTAAGLTGLFGYLFGAVMANIMIKCTQDTSRFVLDHVYSKLK